MNINVQQKSAFFAAAADARISAVYVRDLADVAVAVLTKTEHDNKIYSLTGPDALTFAERWRKSYREPSAGPSCLSMCHPSPCGRRLPAWDSHPDGLIEEFAMYRRSEATTVEPGVGEALGRAARSFDEFARDYAPVFT